MARWFEVYAGCGCVSRTESSKVRLLGYCATHGQDRNQLYRDNVLVWRECHPTPSEGA